MEEERGGARGGVWVGEEEGGRGEDKEIDNQRKRERERERFIAQETCTKQKS